MKKLFDEIPYLEDERIILRKITGRDWRELRKMARSTSLTCFGRMDQLRLTR